MKIFEKLETIGGLAQEKIKELENRLIQGEDTKVLIEEANKTLGDSVEKIIFINKLLNTK